MSQLVLRDVVTNEEIVVPPEGFVFGRAGGDADIQIEDGSLAKRQARVSMRQGNWVLEVMVVPTGQRLPRPQPLGQGSTFFIGQSEFEVLEVEGDGGAAPTIPPQPRPSSRQAIPTKASPAQKRPSAVAHTSAELEPALDDAPNGGVKALFVGVPKGLAYYLVNVPKVLVNPFGAVRRAIEEQPLEVLGKTAIIGYSVPALFFTLALGSIAAGLAALIGPAHSFELLAFVPVIPAVGALVGAVVNGFIFHPVLTVLVDKLGGVSDAKSRSNFFVQLMTLAILLAVPNALGVVVAALPVPFINLLGPLLLTLAAAVSVFVLYRWFGFFKVANWFRVLLLVLGLVGIALGGWNFVQGLRATLAGLGTGHEKPTVLSSGDASSETSTGKAKGAKDPAPQKPAEQPKSTEPKQADPMAVEPKTAEVKPSEPEKPPEPKKPEPVRAEPKQPEPKQAEPRQQEPKPLEPEQTAEEPAGSAFALWAHRREAVEKRLNADPTILAADEGLQRLYGAYVSDVYDIDRKWSKETGKKPELSRLHEHLKQAELFKKTNDQVAKLAAKLGVR